MIVRRQAPDAMEMLRQDADRDRFKCVPFRDPAIGRAQGADVLRQQLRAPVDRLTVKKNVPPGMKTRR